MYVESLNVLFAFDIHRQTPVRIHYAGDEQGTAPFVVSFEASNHYAPSGQIQPDTEVESIAGKTLLWHQEVLDFNFIVASQRIFSIFRLNEAMNEEQISVCNGYIFRRPFPRACQTRILHHIKCNGPMPTCTTVMCLNNNCDEPSTHISFKFDAHSDTHMVPKHWSLQHDLQAHFKNEDGTYTKILLDTSDASKVSDAEATLSLSKLNAPFSINGTTLTLHEGVEEDSDMEAIAYSVVSALLFSIWVFSTGTKDSASRTEFESRQGISDIFVLGTKEIGSMTKNTDILSSLLENLKDLNLTIIFNSSLSIAIASLIAISYEISNKTVFSFLGTELATIFTEHIQIGIVVLYTTLGVAPFFLVGPTLVGMMKLEKYKHLQQRANALTGLNKENSRAYLLVALRLCFEIQLISAFQIHIPPSAGIPFQNIVSFALGVTILIIVGRDLSILHYDRNNRGSVYADCITWITASCAIMYSTLAMTTPFLWSTQIADYKDILPFSTAITSVTVLLGSILFSNQFSRSEARKAIPGPSTSMTVPSQKSGAVLF